MQSMTTGTHGAKTKTTKTKSSKTEERTSAVVKNFLRAHSNDRGAIYQETAP